MNDPTADNKLLNERLLVVQIIVAAMLAGVLAFTGFVLFSEPANPPPIVAAPPPAGAAPAGPVPVALTPILSYAAIAIFAVALLIWSIVPNRLADAQVAKIAAGTWTPSKQSQNAPASSMTDSAKLLAVYTTKSIVAEALLEGPAFLACAAYMIERHAFTMGVVAGAVVLTVLVFPTRPRVRRWLEKQQTFLDETRQFGASSRS